MDLTGPHQNCQSVIHIAYCDVTQVHKKRGLTLESFRKIKMFKKIGCGMDI